MARRSNFYYQDDAALGAAVGQSLARALFGDPEAAQAQQEHLAQMELRSAQARQANANADYDVSRTEGQGIMNGASRGLPDVISKLFTPPAAVAVPVAPADPLAPLPDAPAPRGFDAAAMREGLPAVIASLAQMQGDKVDPRHVVGTIAAMMGDDEFARRGLVAQGQTPGKEFALTADRADAIARQGYDADYKKDTAVASINHATDIPVANINAGADRDVATIKGVTDRDVAKLRPANKGRAAPLSVPHMTHAATQMLFGVDDDPSKPGELNRQLANRGWNLTPGALTDIRSHIVQRFQETGNPVEAVRKTLDLVQLRIEAHQAIAEGRDEKMVRERFTQLTGQAL